MSTVRKRTSNVTAAYGTVLRHLTSNTFTGYHLRSREYCEDIVPATPDRFFTTSHFTSRGGVANGRNSACTYTNWPVDGLNGSTRSHMSTTGTPSDQLAATKVASETNPSEPLVGVGQTIAEMREIPSQLRKRGIDLYNKFNYKNRTGVQIGKQLSMAVADLNLRYQFGIKPLVADLKSLLLIRKQINARIKMLMDIQKKGGILRKRVVFEDTAIYADASAYQIVSHLGASNTWWVKRNVSTYRRKWVYIKWIPDGTNKIPLHEDKHFQRRFLVGILGLNPFNFYNIWTVLPWSWLVDWAFNVGDYLSATNNTVGVKIGAICVCEYEKTTTLYNFTTKPSGVKVEPYIDVLVTKTRRNVTLNVLAKMRLLSARQLGILASIAASK